MSNNIKTIQTRKVNVDALQGWLSPTGQFTPCEWGEHADQASELLKMSDKKWRDFMDDEAYGGFAADYLVFREGYILLDSPAQDGRLRISFNHELITPRQYKYLENCLIALADMTALKELQGFSNA